MIWALFPFNLLSHPMLLVLGHWIVFAFTSFAVCTHISEAVYDKPFLWLSLRVTSVLLCNKNSDSTVFAILARPVFIIKSTFSFYFPLLSVETYYWLPIRGTLKFGAEALQNLSCDGTKPLSGHHTEPIPVSSPADSENDWMFVEQKETPWVKY